MDEKINSIFYLITGLKKLRIDFWLIQVNWKLDKCLNLTSFC